MTKSPRGVVSKFIDPQPLLARPAGVMLVVLRR
jgi:hypothetical protein